MTDQRTALDLHEAGVRAFLAIKEGDDVDAVLLYKVATRNAADPSLPGEDRAAWVAHVRTLLEWFGDELFYDCADEVAA